MTQPRRTAWFAVRDRRPGPDHDSLGDDAGGFGRVEPDRGCADADNGAAHIGEHA